MDRTQSAPEYRESDASAALLADAQYDRDYKRVSQSSEAKVDAAGESNLPAASTNPSIGSDDAKSSDSFPPGSATSSGDENLTSQTNSTSDASISSVTDSSTDETTTSQSASDATISDAPLSPPGDSPNLEVQNESASEWTVMINLAATKTVNSEELGSAEKAEQLKQLVEESQGKPVDIFVQLVDKQEDGSSVLNRYEIENGTLTQLPSKPAEDFASDLQDFISTATANSDSEKLALIINNDGGGTKGMTGDDNPEGQGTSPKEFVDAVQNGLANSGHKKLDLLDMDACLMAEVGFLNSASEVADNFVGSAETERVRPGGVNAQNLNAALEGLFANPEMNGQQFGDSIVEDARNGTNMAPPTDGSNEPTRFDNGTNTLININLENYQEFDAAYNEFGNQLAEALSEPGNRTEIDQLIEETPRFGLERSAVNTDLHNNRDLQTFAENVQQSIKEGALSDDDGSLAKSTQNLLDAQNEITSSYYGQDSEERYDEMGGLSTFLPDSQYRDPQLTAESMTGIGQFQDSVVAFLDRLRNHPENVDDKTVGGIVNALRMESKAVTKSDRGENQQILDPLRTALANLDNVHGVDDLTTAVAGLESITTELLNSELNARLAAEILPSVQDRHNALFGYEAAAGDEGWNRFISALSL